MTCQRRGPYGPGWSCCRAQPLTRARRLAALVQRKLCGMRSRSRVGDPTIHPVVPAVAPSPRRTEARRADFDRGGGDERCSPPQPHEAGPVLFRENDVQIERTEPGYRLRHIRQRRPSHHPNLLAHAILLRHHTHGRRLQLKQVDLGGNGTAKPNRHDADVCLAREGQPGKGDAQQKKPGPDRRPPRPSDFCDPSDDRESPRMPLERSRLRRPKSGFYSQTE